MTKSQLITTLAERLHITNREASSIVSVILSTMTDSLVKGDNIEIRGFGSFSVKEYESYQGRNPRTGQKIAVRPKKLPFFKVGKDLKERVNNG